MKSTHEGPVICIRIGDSDCPARPPDGIITGEQGTPRYFLPPRMADPRKEQPIIIILFQAYRVTLTYRVIELIQRDTFTPHPPAFYTITAHMVRIGLSLHACAALEKRDVASQSHRRRVVLACEGLPGPISERRAKTARSHHRTHPCREYTTNRVIKAKIGEYNARDQTI